MVDNELQPPVDGVAEAAPVLPKDCMLAEEVVCKAFVILLLFFFFQIQTDIRSSEICRQSYEEYFAYANWGGVKNIKYFYFVKWSLQRDGRVSARFALEI